MNTGIPTSSAGKDEVLVSFTPNPPPPGQPMAEIVAMTAAAPQEQHVGGQASSTLQEHAMVTTDPFAMAHEEETGIAQPVTYPAPATQPAMATANPSTIAPQQQSPVNCVPGPMPPIPPPATHYWGIPTSEWMVWMDEQAHKSDQRVAAAAAATAVPAHSQPPLAS